MTSELNPADDLAVCEAAKRFYAGDYQNGSSYEYWREDADARTLARAYQQQATRLSEREGEIERLRDAITRAGFAVMQTSGDWSIHDVSEQGKAEEEKTREVIMRNIELEAALKPFAKAHLYAEQELQNNVSGINPMELPVNPWDADGPKFSDCKRAAEVLAGGKVVNNPCL